MTSSYTSQRSRDEVLHAMRRRLTLLIVPALLVAVVSACASSTTKATTSTIRPPSASATPPATATTVRAPSGSAALPATTASGAAPVITTASPAASDAPAPAAPEVAAAGDIPDNQAFIAFAPSGGSYTIKVPEGWGRSAAGAATLFTDKYNTIRIETSTAATAPTVDSVTKVDLPALASSTKGFKAGKVTMVSRKAGQAVLALYSQDSPPNAVTAKAIQVDVERYVFWKGGNAVVVTLSSAAGSDNVDPWRAVTDGFGWV